ncbi:cysteine peptidase family C39 domain-containing protein [Nocardiopsis baichengensis]|uniref:cysteine peptidase family C39 domain-containing protein n=1 Tax=Nocardiopsis baichengensis TaxID=280240 RepID=UPI00036D434B|nr:cysteine peptidase family C39 domain-containing protein [Nocardiopsis baichengensis]
MPRVRALMQTSPRDCGAVCLSMVLRARGIPAFPFAVAAVLPSRTRGASAYDLVQAARRSGAAARGFRASAAQLGALPLPLIAHYGSGHYVVVESVSPRRGRLTVVDPSSGRRRLSTAEFEREFSGVVIGVEPPGAPLPRRAALLRDQHRLLFDAGDGTAGPWRRLLPVLLLAAAAVFLPAAATQYFYRRLMADAPIADGVLVAAGLLLAIGLFAAFTVVRESAARRAQDRAQAGRIAYLSGLLRTLDPFYLSQRSPHEVSHELVEGPAAHEAATTAALSAIGSFMTAGLGLGFLLAFEPAYFSAAAVMSVLAFLSAVGVGRRQSDASQGEMEEFRAFGAQTGVVVESLEDHRGIGADAWLLERWRSTGTDWLARASHRRRFTAAGTAVQRVATLLVPLVMLALTHDRITSGELSLPLALGLNMVAIVTVGAFVPLANDLQRYTAMAPTAVKWEAGARLQPPPWRRHGGATRQTSDHAARGAAVEARGLACAPPGAAGPVVGPLDLRVEPGELIAVTGPSGCGKTTLLRTLAGLVPPATGSVVHGSVPEDADATAFVSQEPVLPGGPLGAMVAAGLPLGDGEIREAFAALGAEDIIDGLPDGLASALSPRCPELSAGQRRRVALARALLRRSAVLLLDEPTAGLDRDSAAAVVDRLRSHPGAVVVATHDERLAEEADRVVDLSRAPLTTRSA